jgi:hypothetical protein
VSVMNRAVKASIFVWAAELVARRAGLVQATRLIIGSFHVASRMALPGPSVERRRSHGYRSGGAVCTLVTHGSVGV